MGMTTCQRTTACRQPKGRLGVASASSGRSLMSKAAAGAGRPSRLRSTADSLQASRAWQSVSKIVSIPVPCCDTSWGPALLSCSTDTRLSRSPSESKPWSHGSHQHWQGRSRAATAHWKWKMRLLHSSSRSQAGLSYTSFFCWNKGLEFRCYPWQWLG